VYTGLNPRKRTRFLAQLACSLRMFVEISEISKSSVVVKGNLISKPQIRVSLGLWWAVNIALDEPD
jgi:hypothetical protein